MDHFDRCWQRPALLGLSVAVWVVMLAGCMSNPADYPDLGNVTGTVTLDGQPLTGADVSFFPASGGRPTSGKTDTEGRYELRYSGSILGAPLGNNRVSISKLAPDPNDEPEFVIGLDGERMQIDSGKMINVVPENYSGEESDLTANVESGKNTIDFELTIQ